MMRRMLNSALAVAFILLAGVPVTAAAQANADTASLPEGLRTARTALAEAYGRMDGAAAAAMFTDNAVVEFQGQVLSGKQAVGGWFGEMFAGLSSLQIGTSTFAVGEGEVTERAGYTVVTAQGDQGEGRTETLWKRQADGSWKVARLIVL